MLETTNETNVARNIIAKCCEPVLAPEELEDGALFADLGIDSLKFMLAVLEIEQAIRRSIFLVDDVAVVNTPADLFALIERTNK